MKQTKINLEDIGTRKPFEVPEGYFKDFSAHIEKSVEEKPVKVYKLMKPWMYMAAMFTGILIMGSVVSNIYTKNSTTGNDNYELYMLSQLDENVIYDYYLKDNGNKESQTKDLKLTEKPEKQQ